MGKVIGAKYIVLGTVSRFGNTYSLDARFVDVESSESIRSGDYTTSKAIDNLLLQGVKSVVKQLTGEDVEDVVSQDIEKPKPNQKIWESNKPISYFRFDSEVASTYVADYAAGSGGDNIESGFTIAYDYAKPNGWGYGFEFQFFRPLNYSALVGYVSDQNPNVDLGFSSFYGTWNFTFSTGLNFFIRAGISFLNFDEKSFYFQPISTAPFGNEWSMAGFGIRYPISDSMAFELGSSGYSSQSGEVYSRAYVGLNFLF